MPFNLRLTRIAPLAILACLAMATVGVVATGADAKQSTKRSTRSCNPPNYPGDGYFSEIRATRISCSYSKRFVVRFYRCRTRSSKSGTCPRSLSTSRLSRFRCSERRTTISTQIASTVTCRRGDSRIIHSYQQNL
jgi:hypothetical protein